MSRLPGFRYDGNSGIGSLRLPGSGGVRLSAPIPKNPQRTKIWELSSNLHCSIIGTCLTGPELRSFLHKMGEADVKAATDHTLHGRGVMSAGRPDRAGKMLQRTLDRRHDVVIKRFSRVKTTEEVRVLWRACFDDGEIGGAYWAVLTHPATDRTLVNDVFGEVHMLSHLVGSSSRLDIGRLRSLQCDVEASVEKLARQQERLRASAAERAQLQQRITMLEQALVNARAVGAAVYDDDASHVAGTALRNRLDAETARADALQSRLAVTAAKLTKAEQSAILAVSQSTALQKEVGALEAAMFERQQVDLQIEGRIPLEKASVLYVGGRRNLFDRLRMLADARGFDLLIHDGGIEDNNSHLPSLLGQADLALFPIDCVSHSAALMIKRLCRDAGKRFVPLRSASLASFLASLDTVQTPADV